ncbi:unnamed protein product [Acanthoscelides obtectus]|uniref:Transmembrane protein n=1 Tax=Acanthoscelides obtectus TaxID=200917 RepID=A0A9P0PGH5_ACAOB|nr:unnamed protein product [Acanthoscelides obtectus]CAK1657710.1 hypothetical protein AOBTE_LOCUS20499 [Acanthoscelides obtectus]
MKPLRYYQFIEKDTSEISIVWKVLHATIFCLIAVNSCICVYGFIDIFDIFNYNCILYGKPYFTYDNYMRTDVKRATTASPNATDTTATNTIADHSTTPATTVTPQALILALEESDTTEVSVTTTNATNTTEIDPYERVDEVPDAAPANVSLKPDLNSSIAIPNTDNLYVYDDEIWVVTDYMWGKIIIVVYKSVFSTVLMCDYVIFIPMLSMVVSSVFAGVVMVCGRGGRGYSSDTIPGAWIVVYPIIIGSGVMFILSLNANTVVNNGLRDFCGRLSEYTGTRSCSVYVDYLTKQQKAGKREFYRSYQMCYITYKIQVALWLAQLVLGLLRILLFTDFDFYSVLVKRKDDDSSAAAAEELWDPSKIPKLAMLVQQAQEQKQKGKK